jgi:two-component system NtrC family sensor kinase
LIYFYQNFPNYLDVWIVSGWIGNLAGVAGVLFGAKALFTLFNFKAGRGFTAVIILAIVLMVAVNVFWWMPKIVFTYLAIFIIAIQFWLAMRAFWHKKRGAYIIALGFFAATVGVTVYLLAYAQIISVSFIVSLVASSVAVLGSTFGISIYLAREFALDSLLLQVKLTQVEELSAKTIAQEQEKQVMLAGQNEVLEQQVKERTADLSDSLNTLKSTQNQLIQSEKMASLGELTAGIAHEIQNPLNFVNNFSEVNREMLEELKAESKKPKAERDEQLESELIDDLIENEGKINHHGKRADGIVKGMLEHSRASTGQKEPTDLNKLADEYLRLAYHGLRANDKSFNAELVTHFDSKLPLVNIIPQDIGRVLLNLFNNAFYAVQQMQKTAAADYNPAVEVTTFTSPPGGGGLGISIKDNGTGIPDAIKDKIMQPFFTTKPTGEGTGLGLSLAYDMVVKGHGGSMHVNSIEGEGSEFIIRLPGNQITDV